MVLYRMLPWLRIGFGLLGMVAIARQLVVQIQLSFSVVNFFSYFTNLANGYAAGVLILGGCRSITGREVFRLGEPARVASVAYMAVVGIVFGLLLRTVDLGSLRPWVNDVLHIVMPCIVVIDWLAAPPGKKLDSHILPRLLIFPAVYLAYVLIRGSEVGWYPYPFLDPARPGGYPSVIGYAAGIAATFVFLALMTIAVGNKLMSRPSRSWVLKR
jgi:hypothetical protein